MMYRNAITITITAAAIIICLTGCGSAPYPDNVMSTLKAAGNNRAQLEQVLTHYTELGDSLKLEAAYFLIGNMEGHCYATYRFIDTSGNEVIFDPLVYPDYASVQAAADSVEHIHGEMDYERKDKIMDAETITTEFLIDNIDRAFEAWQNNPWAQNLSFENFRDYVLPYRGSNEPLEPWREHFQHTYASLAGALTDPTDPMEAASVINDTIMSWFTFDPRYYYHPTDQGLSEMIAHGKGRCEDMTNLTIYALRSNGLAVTSDYTPHWADANNNHAWNAIVTPNGMVVPFMGAESNPGNYKLANKFAKVYRKSFGANPDNLIFQKRKQDEVPGWLAGRNYIDVTAAYQDVCDVTVTFDREIPDSVDIAYLCVFNSGQWQAIHWGRIENGKATFIDMGKDIAYIPALYLNKELVTWGMPFIVNDDCSQQSLAADTGRVITVTAAATTGRVLKKSTDGIAKSYLTTGREYELFYMDDDWKSLGTAIAGETPLVFENVPIGGLFRLVAVDGDDEERIFTFENDRQVWW